MPSYSAITWTTANTSVASVAKSDTTGVVTGLSVGETQVLATIGNVIAHISVNVVP
jgi:Bacterial Ig-like domain (group 2)